MTYYTIYHWAPDPWRQAAASRQEWDAGRDAGWDAWQDPRMHDSDDNSNNAKSTCNHTHSNIISKW